MNTDKIYATLARTQMLNYKAALQVKWEITHWEIFKFSEWQDNVSSLEVAGMGVAAVNAVLNEDWLSYQIGKAFRLHTSGYSRTCRPPLQLWNFLSNLTQVQGI